MSTKEAINPKHYEFKVNGHVFQTVDLMESHFPNDMHLSQALKYLMRVGRKPTSTYLTDLGKCLWWICRAMMFHGAKSIELPPGAPITPEKVAHAPQRKLKSHPGIKK